MRNEIMSYIWMAIYSFNMSHIRIFLLQVCMQTNIHIQIKQNVSAYLYSLFHKIKTTFMNRRLNDYE